MRILITGGSGMLGTDARHHFQSLGHQVLWTSRDGSENPGQIALDITDSGAVRTAFLNHSPDVVLHAAAFTHVEGCERDPDRAYRVNALGSWAVASAAEAVRAQLVLISTDFVFDGDKAEPYTEFDTPRPLNAYGASKLAGETMAARVCSRLFTVRTSWLYGIHGRNFPYTILNQAAHSSPIGVVADQKGSPTYTVDLVRTITPLLDGALYGTYHVCNGGAVTWFEFARAILDRGGFAGYPLEKLTSEQAAQRFDVRTNRPHYSVLRRYALELLCRDTVRPWEEALQEFLDSARRAGKLPTNREEK